LGLREFFRDFLPIATWEEYLEEVFALTYCIPGITWAACLDLRRNERLHLLRLLADQKRNEADTLKKASKRR
jgi:hypothetical protein